jgi:hypothetical protein
VRPRAHLFICAILLHFQANPTPPRGRDEPIALLEKWNVVRGQHYPEPPGYDRRLGTGP